MLRTSAKSMKNWDYTSRNCHEKQDADNVSVTKASEHEEKILLKTNAKVGARTKQNEVLMTSASREIEERSAEYKNENSREKRRNFSQFQKIRCESRNFKKNLSVVTSFVAELRRSCGESLPRAWPWRHVGLAMERFCHFLSGVCRMAWLRHLVDERGSVQRQLYHHAA